MFPGFMYLHTLFLTRGRLESTWTVLKTFGAGSAATRDSTAARGRQRRQTGREGTPALGIWAARFPSPRVVFPSTIRQPSVQTPSPVRHP